MNLIIRAMAEALNGEPTYAWIITQDKVSDGEDVGTSGPSNAPAELLVPPTGDGHDAYRLTAGRTRWTFRMYDDDGEHYYTGQLVTAADTPEEDETGPNGALMAPLSDFGQPNAGCTVIKWQGHPEWECG